MAWEKELEAAKAAGEKARAVLMKYLGHLQHVTMKPDLGLVSEADRESEKVIFEYLNAQGFTHSFLGEETGYTKQNEGGRWIVDPLDGTTNYVHGFPFFCVSIGLEVNGELVVGYVSAPALGMTFWASKGGGAFQDGKQIHVREVSALEDSFIATGFNYLEEKDLESQIRMFHKLIPKTHGIRRAGAAALDICLVANGTFDAFWERGLKAWDIAAGAVILREAGGVLSGYYGEDFNVDGPTMISASRALHPIMLAELAEFKPGP